MRRVNRPALAAASALAALAVAAAGQAGTAEDTTLLCHGTSSADNPYILIRINVNGLNGHLGDHGPQHDHDFVPDPDATSCEGGQ